jgi:hypothetical protein
VAVVAASFLQHPSARPVVGDLRPKQTPPPVSPLAAPLNVAEDISFEPCRLRLFVVMGSTGDCGIRWMTSE